MKGEGAASRPSAYQPAACAARLSCDQRWPQRRRSTSYRLQSRLRRDGVVPPTIRGRLWSVSDDHRTSWLAFASVFLRHGWVRVREAAPGPEGDLGKSGSGSPASGFCKRVPLYTCTKTHLATPSSNATVPSLVVESAALVLFPSFLFSAISLIGTHFRASRKPAPHAVTFFQVNFLPPPGRACRLARTRQGYTRMRGSRRVCAASLTARLLRRPADHLGRDERMG